MKRNSSTTDAPHERTEHPELNMADEHRRFVLRIPEFFEDTLEDAELSEFLTHYDSCDECRDEMAIQFLIREGLARVESGTAFNFDKEMTGYVEAERERLLHREQLTRFTLVLELFTVLAFTAFIVLYVLYYIL